MFQLIYPTKKPSKFSKAAFWHHRLLTSFRSKRLLLYASQTFNTLFPLTNCLPTTILTLPIRFYFHSFVTHTHIHIHLHSASFVFPTISQPTGPTRPSQINYWHSGSTTIKRVLYWNFIEIVVVTIVMGNHKIYQ